MTHKSFENVFEPFIITKRKVIYLSAWPDRRLRHESAGIIKENILYAMKTLRRRHAVRFASLCAAAALLAACSRPPGKTEEIRPVRALVLHSAPAEVNAEFSGEVRPRVESRLGFRVGGKIVARQVDVGAVVRRGQLLMRLDPQDLLLSQAQALAGLRAAESGRDLARAELLRYQELRAKAFVSQAVLEAKDSAFKAAQASVDSAQAAYRGQANQAGYASLVSDVDGVVTAVDAEAGQVVAPGAPVVRVAKAGENEVVIGIPEDQVEALRAVADIEVRLWALPGRTLAGRIREIAPVADAATRTFTVKIALAKQGLARPGMTASVRFASKTAAARVKVPLTALFQEKGVSSVWLVEHGAVRLVPVKLGGADGNELWLTGGVQAGQTVVTAGVNLLKPGQKVTILGADGAPGARP